LRLQLSSGAQLLILDERPAFSLLASGRCRFTRSVRNLKLRGLTILFIVIVLKMLYQWTDRVICCALAKMAENPTSREIRLSPTYSRHGLTCFPLFNPPNGLQALGHISGIRGLTPRAFRRGVVHLQQGEILVFAGLVSARAAQSLAQLPYSHDLSRRSN